MKKNGFYVTLDDNNSPHFCKDAKAAQDLILDAFAESALNPIVDITEVVDGKEYQIGAEWVVKFERWAVKLERQGKDRP